MRSLKVENLKSEGHHVGANEDPKLAFQSPENDLKNDLSQFQPSPSESVLSKQTKLNTKTSMTKIVEKD